VNGEFSVDETLFLCKSSGGQQIHHVLLQSPVNLPLLDNSRLIATSMPSMIHSIPTRVSRLSNTSSYGAPVQGYEAALDKEFVDYIRLKI